MAIVYISHELAEVLRVCDSVTVLRDGGVVAARPAAGYTVDGLVALMVGRELRSPVREAPPPTDPAVLELRGVRRAGASARELYYQRMAQKTGTGDMMAVALTFSPRLQAAPPRRLLTADMAAGIHAKAATADGSRLLLVLNPPPDTSEAHVPRLTVATDWRARLAR